MWKSIAKVFLFWVVDYLIRLYTTYFIDFLLTCTICNFEHGLVMLILSKLSQICFTEVPQLLSFLLKNFIEWMQMSDSANISNFIIFVSSVRPSRITFIYLPDEAQGAKYRGIKFTNFSSVVWYHLLFRTLHYYLNLKLRSHPFFTISIQDKLQYSVVRWSWVQHSMCVNCEWGMLWVRNLLQTIVL